MSRAIISLGSSLGDRKEMLKQAVERISFANKIILLSDVYETEAKDENGAGPYLNCCLEVETDMQSSQMILFLQETQKQLTSGAVVAGMVKENIDCDLIAFDNEVLRTPQLTLPHPSAHRRAFVMIPLASIRPDWVHPVLNKPASDLAQETYWTGWGHFFAPAKSIDPGGSS